jgi:hypothetical protein
MQVPAPSRPARKRRQAPGITHRERTGVVIWRLSDIWRELANDNPRKWPLFKSARWQALCICLCVFRIVRSANGEVVLTLIGRISDENLPELKSVMALERNISRVVLDLKDVTLVDREVVHFLGQCERDKIGLKNCPAYIRDWIKGSQKRKPGRKK